MKLFSELINAYSSSLNWLRSNGFNTEGRLNHYHKSLIDLLKTDVCANGLIDKAAIHKLIPILHNITEIVCIYKAFQADHINTSFRSKLKLMTKGPFYQVFEKPSNDSCKARNYQFELFSAAMFRNAGWNIDFDDKSDFSANKNGFAIAVECKRLRSVKKIEKEMNDAIDKLSNILNNSAIGLITLNITPVMHGDTIIVDSESDATKVMELIINDIPFDSIKHSINVFGFFIFGSFVRVNEIQKRVSCPYRILMKQINDCEEPLVYQIKSILNTPFFTSNYANF